MRFLIPFLFLVNASHVLVAASIYEDEVQSYIQTFSSGSNEEIKKACENMQWEGLHDDRVYETIKDELTKRTPKWGKFSSNADRDTFAWLAKALVYTGKEGYRDFLNSIKKKMKSKTVVRHLDKVLDEKTEYSKWNEEIWGKEKKYPEMSGTDNRTLNKLNSENLFLVRLGAQKIFHRQVRTPEILQKAEDVLKRDYLRYGSTNDFLSVDAFCWLVKSLGMTKNTKYLAIFEEIMQKGEIKQVHSKLASYAKKYHDYIKK